jgi:hypothetical protein
VRGDTMGRPDRAAAPYGAINAISDRLDLLIRRSALKSAITVDLSTVTRVRLFNCPGNQGRYTTAIRPAEHRCAGIGFVPLDSPAVDIIICLTAPNV